MTRGVKGTTTPHGSASTYTNHKCRCPACKEAWAITHRDYMHRHPEQMEKQAVRKRERWQNPEYRERARIKNSAYLKNRYATDLEFREHVKELNRDRYARNAERMRAKRRERYARAKGQPVRSYRRG